MSSQPFSIFDIDNDLIHFADMYLKKVIIDAKRYYYHEKTKMKKHGIVLVDLETLSETLGTKTKILKLFYVNTLR